MNKKGSIAIIVVVGTTLTLTLAVLTLYVLVNAKLVSLKNHKDRFIAYYLCESGISAAMYDLANGKVGNNDERDVSYPTDANPQYRIHYKITKLGGTFQITSSVALNGRTYYLKAAGRRAVPIFIKGYAGGK